MKVLVFLLLYLPITCFSQEHARIISSKTVYDITGINKIDITYTKTIKINSKNGYKFAVEHDYYDKFKKISSVSLTIFDSRGNRINKLSKSDALDIALNDNYEVNDTRQLILDPDYALFPFTLVIKKKVRYNESMYIPDWIPRNDYYLGVDTSSLVINLNPEVSVRIDTSGVFEFDYTEDNKTRSYTYKITNLKPVNSTVHRKEFYDAQPKVRIAPNEFQIDGYKGDMSTWKGFGDWYYQLNTLPDNISEKTKEFIKSISNKSNIEKIALIYKYMQNNTRYISMQFGIGGFKSISASEVESSGYGDCKGLSTYTKSMLEVAGIKSNYVLIRAGSEARDIDKTFPSNQFNHVIIGVPLESDTIFLECTSQVLPYGYLGTFTDDRYAVWIEKENSKLIRTPSYGSDLNFRKSNANVIINEEGDAVVKLEIINSGSFYDDLYVFQQAPQDYVEKYNYDRFNFKDFEIINFSFNRDDNNIPQYSLNYEISIQNLARKVGSNFIVPYNLFDQFVSYFDSYEEYSNFALSLRDVSIDLELNIELPQGYELSNTPEDLLLNSNFGSYSHMTVKDGSKLTVKKSVVLKKAKYTGSEFELLEESVDLIKKKENSMLLCKKEY